ncbi:hypothetical protein DDP46_00130 [Helicobacter pylori]|nr:hypothetical protein DDP46_00130 [Helicobacter pylori]
MVPKYPKNLFFFFFFETIKRPISTKIPPIYAILTKSCDKISYFYKTYLTISILFQGEYL